MAAEITVETKGGDKEAKVTIAGEGNFVANALRGELTEDKGVSFAAGKLEHPLIKNAVILAKVSKGSATKAVAEAADRLAARSKEFGKKFSDEYK